MASKFALDFNDLVGVRPTEDPQRYESVSSPERMGNLNAIAYGGCTIGVAISAACQSVDPRYQLYSAMGNYLGAALIDRKFSCSVRPMRDTRAFATRFVEVSQILDNGTVRTCLLLLADFQVPEKATLMIYSPPVSLPQLPIESVPANPELRQKMVDDGRLPAKMAALHATVFGLMARHFENRMHPEGLMAQNLGGMAKKLPTSQDERPLTSKVSGEYVRALQSFTTPGQNMAAMGFYLDCALSFVPLSHSRMFLDDAGACSSLDFSLRIFQNDIKMRDWHWREMATVTGGEGRTYSEARMFDVDGILVASMTQQSILRPPPEKRTKAAL